jgi:hypothetical protein
VTLIPVAVEVFSRSCVAVPVGLDEGLAVLVAPGALDPAGFVVPVVACTPSDEPLISAYELG